MKHNAAFTLVETMVALGVFVIAVGGSISAIEAISTTIVDLRMDVRARQNIENHIAELRGLRPLTSEPLNPNAGGDKDITLKDEVDPIVDAEAGIAQTSGILRVRITASWTTRHGAQSLTNTIIVKGRN